MHNHPLVVVGVSKHAEEVLLDENAAAKRHEFYMVGGFEVSPNHK